MGRFPKQSALKGSRITPNNIEIDANDNVLFSFMRLEENKYFSLDKTCENWSSELLQIMKTVSSISKKDINAGKYSNEGSPLRIHRHENAKPPCPWPVDVDPEEFYQIRISASKGGFHGVFIDRVFYVVWLDPHHNLYPSDRHGGLKPIVRPPTPCCKERNERIAELEKENTYLKEQIEAYEDLFQIEANT